MSRYKNAKKEIGAILDNLNEKSNFLVDGSHYQHGHEEVPVTKKDLLYLSEYIEYVQSKYEIASAILGRDV